MKAVVLGATRGMGRELARRIAERGESIFLLGRAPAELEREARDLSVRAGGAHVGTAPCDLEDPSSFAPALDAAGDFDTVIVTAGIFAPQGRLDEDLPLAGKVLQVDFAHTILFCEEARRRLLQRGGGTICVFSSVAGERGRKPVVVYGAAKAGLSHYLEGRDHSDRARGLRWVTVKPGWIHTEMTEGLPVPPFSGQPDEVARIALAAIDRGTPVVYAPRAWRYLMGVIRALPRAVMRRAHF